MERSKARACAMKLVYEWIMGGDGGDETLINLLDVEPGENEADFMDEIVSGVKNFSASLDEEISKRLAGGWSLARISNVDHAILLVGTYELIYTDTATGVIINEAVELAKQYSDDKAGSFVNGVLGNIGRSVRNA